MSGSNYSHVALLSDGITSVMSNEEINDLVKFSPTPVKAAQRVISFAEEMGSEDNATAIVVPLLGWGKCTGIDGTKELREYRSGQMGIYTHFRLPVLIADKDLCRGQEEDVKTFRTYSNLCNICYVHNGCSRFQNNRIIMTVRSLFTSFILLVYKPVNI